MIAAVLPERVSRPRGSGQSDVPLDIRHLVVNACDAHPSDANGVHRVARWLVGEQRAAGERASLVLLAKARPIVRPDDACPTQFLPLAGPSLGGRVVRLRREIVDLLLSDIESNTVFHIHGCREPALAGLTRALRRKRIPYAVTIHGRFSHIYDTDGRCQKLSTALYLKLIERPWLSRASFVQALSPDEERVLRRIAPRARIEVVGNGAYSSRLGRMPTRSDGRLPSPTFPHFVYLGRYEVRHKGLDLLFQGFARYRQGGGLGRLTTVGTGPVREQLVRMARELGVADAVEVHGPMFGDDRDAILRRCDFFVLPSRFEGVPLAALEAALLGLPLIVTAGTGLRSAVESNRAGVAIRDLTAEAVCVAMHRAAGLSAAEWSAQAASAYKLALSIGDWTTIAGRLRELYLR
jgi:glycosyltransferase involved in cell wall biosynthesis